MGKDSEGVDEEVCCGEEVRVGEGVIHGRAGLYVRFSPWDVVGGVCLRIALA